MHIGFTCSTDTDLVVEEIARKEQLITSSKIDQVRKLVQRILDLCRFFFSSMPKIVQKDDMTFAQFCCHCYTSEWSL